MRTVKECVLDIALAAQTLYENLNYVSCRLECAPENEIAQQRLKRWREYAAANDNLVFAKRLAWDGLTEESVLMLLNDGIPGNEPQSSAWMLLLEEVLGQVGYVKADELSKSPHLFRGARHPFAELHMLFANIGIKRLCDQSGQIGSLLTPRAFTDLVRFLLVRLSFVSTDVLFKELELKHNNPEHVRAFWQPAMNISIYEGIWDDPSTIWGKRYLSFIDQLLEGEILAVLQKYPVMARLMSQFTLFWVGNSIEFINALCVDMDDISTTFWSHRSAGRVGSIECGLADPHNGGRSVAKLEFESGLKLIYKARNIGIEESYYDFAAQMNALADEEMFKVLKILNKEGYGWVEYCAELPCRTEQEVAGFYRHSGMLLGMLYLLAGYDFHHENIIAQGEYPVVVDPEVLLQPQPEYQKSDPRENSVMDTSLLPVQFVMGENGYYSLESLGSGQLEQSPAQPVQNMEAIILGVGGGLIDRGASKGGVNLDSRLVRAQEHSHLIVAGFKQFYAIMLKHRDKFIAEESPLRVFENKRVRYVFRKTQTYFVTLYNSLRPQYQDSGLARSIRLDKISRTLLTYGEKPRHWDIIRYEHQAFDRGDIPIFYINTCARQLENENGFAIEDFFTSTPIETVKDRISNLSAADMNKQCRLIRECYRLNNAIMQGSRSPKAEQTEGGEKGASITPKQVLAAAGVIADYILHSAIVARGGVTWLNSVKELNQSIMLKIMKDNLYEGKAGVLLFLSAYGKISGNETVLEFLSKVMRNETSQAVERVQERSSINGCIGAGKGIGGIIYGLVKMSEFTGDESFLRQAFFLSQSISNRLISNDAEYDVFSGSSGLILGLLALHAAYPADRVLHCAVNCGDYLLKCRATASNGLQAWKPAGIFTVNNQPVPGFFRGLSGIAFALAKLYRATGQEKYLQAAREAIMYENSVLFDKDYRWSGPMGQNNDQQLSWCSGAAGVCLNRVEAGDIIGLECRDSNIKATIDLMRHRDLSREDLLWGNFGLIDVLISSSCRLDDEMLFSEALKKAKRYVDKCNGASGSGFLYGYPEGVHDISFFNGISGIGYVLLRLVDKRLPSILAFE